MNTIHDDLIERSVDVHWPTGFDSESADLFAHNTIVIAASAESMWAKLTTLPPGPPGIPTPATSSSTTRPAGSANPDHDLWNISLKFVCERADRAGWSHYPCRSAGDIAFRHDSSA